MPWSRISARPVLTIPPQHRGKRSEADMEPKRARRIRDKMRMKAKAVRVFTNLGVPNPVNVKLADHIAHCSGPCCGNPRRWFGEKTMQEKRAFEAAQA